MMNKLSVLFVFVIANTFNCFSREGTWQIVKTKNQAAGRSECGMAAVNGKLYLVEGFTRNFYSKIKATFDLAFNPGKNHFF